MMNKNQELEKELAKKAVAKKKTTKSKTKPRYKSTPEEMKEKRSRIIKCKNCGEEMNAFDRLGRPRTFCSLKCTGSYLGESNLKYTEEFIENELREMWRFLNEVPFILFIKELFETKEYTYQRFSEWAGMYPNNTTISDLIKQIVEVTEIRQFKAGIFGVVNVTTRDQFAEDGDQVYYQSGKEVNSAFLKFTMMNHHNYKTRENTENNNINQNVDVTSIMNDIWDQNDKTKQKKSF